MYGAKCENKPELSPVKFQVHVFLGKSKQRAQQFPYQLFFLSPYSKVRGATSHKWVNAENQLPNHAKPTCLICIREGGSKSCRQLANHISPIHCSSWLIAETASALHETLDPKAPASRMEMEANPFAQRFLCACADIAVDCIRKRTKLTKYKICRSDLWQTQWGRRICRTHNK